jgi:hypothetical protein
MIQPLSATRFRAATRARTSPAAGSCVPGLGYRQAGLDLIVAAAAVLLRDHTAGLGEVGDGAVGAALGDAQAARDVAHLAPGSCAMCNRTRAWLARKPDSAMEISQAIHFWN